ncbi:Glutathione-regulated potassium-efflux system protein kefC [Rhynchospora pubera]|uniref:Glutathione-regulated potassium-efflux system protein kefC n=1 Tax=Rhynchospora pubera TaxID=906938 RepID=A0AAV8ED47_9POAL|nr:Glutathione-regulated potassium-efflux system protein kefC [Rhynchospora pubera]
MDFALCRGIGSSSSIACLGRSRSFLVQSRVNHRSHSIKNSKKKLEACSVNLLLVSSIDRDAPFLYKNRNTFKAPYKLKCNPDDSPSYTDESTEKAESDSEKDPELTNNTQTIVSAEEGKDSVELEVLRELLQRALKELDVARLNSTSFEERAQSISETAIALKDKAENALRDVTVAVSTIQEIMKEEDTAKEAVRKATMSFCMAESRLIVAMEALTSKKSSSSPDIEEEELAVSSCQNEINDCQCSLAVCEEQLKQLQEKRLELQKEVDRLNEIAEKAQIDASKAEEDVADIMLLAEQAVALELEAAQRVSDAEVALQKAEKVISAVVDIVDPQVSNADNQVTGIEDQLVTEESTKAIKDDVVSEIDELLKAEVSAPIDSSVEEIEPSHAFIQESTDTSTIEPEKEIEIESEKTKNDTKKQEAQQKDLTKDSTSTSSPKASVKKSSRFFSASFFSSDKDGTGFTLSSVSHGLAKFLRVHAPKVIFGVLFLGIGTFFIINRAEKNAQFISQPDIVTGIEEVTSTTGPVVKAIRKFPKRIKRLIEQIPHQELKEGEASLLDVLSLLLASVIFVPIFQRIPGGSPVLGYLAAGVLIGPYGFSFIRHVHVTKEIAEFGVVFLLFNIGLELSVERLSSMKKYVFGLGTAQVLATATAVGLISHYFCGQPGPAAVVIGSGLALSSTAVVLQVLQERGESTSRYGRATFSVLLFQDLAVVVLLILIPLISPNSSPGGVGFQAIAEALGKAAVKAMVAITAIIAGGRLLLRPIYKQIAENQNAEIFSANTLLVILGTSLLTARAGLSMALGAFLAGLLLAETEFSLQVESDIAPYRGLLLGLFFMTVGMSIDPKLLFSNFPVILGTLGLLIAGKTILVLIVGKLFGISPIAAFRVGLMLAPGGEFAFVAFGEAVNQGLLSLQLSSLLFLVVGISMALTPWLAAGGQVLASKFEQHDVRSLLPAESETDDLQDHIIICGFGRVGQIIAQLLSERLIPFVALDVSSDRVAFGRALDLPVYFGDAGSREVLHKVGAERASAAAIALDTPGANYRAVWALSKYFPNVKTFVRAHDVDHGINLEKAGASAVVPETLEPSLQLAAAVLAQAKMPTSEIATTINEFRSRHLSELTEYVPFFAWDMSNCDELCATSGSSLGYGFSRVMSKPPKAPASDPEDTGAVDGTLAAV